MKEKIYRVKLNSNGAPNFATAEEIPQGKWIFHSEWEEHWCRYECSLCGRTFDHDMNYCGFCGARMKGADDE